MTDYLYSLSLAQQTKGFLLALGMGFALGVLYDLIRIVRISISRGKTAVIICDVIFCIAFCLVTFMFCLTVNEGEIRFYLVAGEGFGFSVYYFSLGAVIFGFSERLISGIRSIFGKIFLLVFTPFKKLSGKICKQANKIAKKSRKNSQKIKNKSKFLLKVDKLLLYNLFVKKQISVDGKDFESEEE